ncbi:hypothetical protein ES708_00230 [subsurface metagenome]
MLGQATVTIKENQWNVWVANTTAELTTGLSGEESIPAGTGMLFVLPAKQQVTVDTTNMLFPIDIIFISENLVIDVARNIQPGYLVTEETPCDMFLEVNAGEAEGIEAGDTISAATIQEPGFDWSSIIAFAIPLAVLGFVCAMGGGMATAMAGSSSPPKRLAPVANPGEKKLWYLGEWWEEEYSTAECVIYRSADGKKRLYAYWDGTKEVKPAPHLGSPPVCSKCGLIIFRTTEKYYDTPQGIFCFGCVPKIYKTTEYEKVYKPVSGEHHSMGLTPEPRWKQWSRAKRAPVKAEELVHRIVEHEAITGVRVTPERVVDLAEGIGWEISLDDARELLALREHHSMWLTLEERKELEKKYGMVAVRWAEEATKPGDIEAAERAAEYYYGKVKEALGLGHLSPKLSEEQIMKLREVLGLPADLGEILKIHQETGYIP